MRRLKNIFKKDKENIFVSAFSFLRYGYIKIYFALLFLVNCISWLSAKVIHREIAAEQVALHYNVDFGIDYYGSIDKIYTLPSVGMVIIFFNIFLFIEVIRHKDIKFISHILFLTALLANVIILADVTSIYLINFR